MAVSVTMPQLGESVTEGTVTRWLKAEGEYVNADEPLLEVSTDKVDTEIPAPASGILLRITAGEDAVVLVGGELAVIGDTADATDAPPTGPADYEAPAPAHAAPGPRLGRGAGGSRAGLRADPFDHLARGPPRSGAGAHPRRRSGHRHCDAGPAPRPGRERHRGHRHPLAQAGRRAGGRGRAARRGLHRQGRHRDPVAGRGCAAGDHRRGRRHDCRRRPARRRRGRGGGARRSPGARGAGPSRSRAGADVRPGPGLRTGAPGDAPCAARRRSSGARRPGPGCRAHRGRRRVRRRLVRHPAGPQARRRARRRPRDGGRHRGGRAHPQGRRAGGCGPRRRGGQGRGPTGPAAARRRGCTRGRLLPPSRLRRLRRCAAAPSR